MVEKKIIFVISDHHQHGGHVKSFFAQFMSIKNELNRFHIVCSTDGFVEQNLNKLLVDQNNITTYAFHNLRKWNFSFNLYQVIKQQLKDDTILHIYSPECYFSALLAKQAYHNVTLVHSVLGGPLPFACLKSTDLYIAVSYEQKLQAQKINKKKCNIKIIKNRISIQENRKNDLLDKKNEKILLIVSRYDKDKIKSLMLIQEIVKKLSKDVKVVFAGKGDFLEEYRQEFEGDVNVSFIGFTSNLLEYKENAGVVLGMGRSVLEFLLYGVPAIIVGFNGIELLDDVESVKFASDHNFAGRKIHNPVSVNTTVKEINNYLKQNKTVGNEVIHFLNGEYDSIYFKQKYMQVLKGLSGKKVGYFRIFIEYIQISILRVINFLKYKKIYFK